jgi:hypothetical protein
MSHGRVTIALAEGNPSSGCLPNFNAQCRLPPLQRSPYAFSSSPHLLPMLTIYTLVYRWRVSRFGVDKTQLSAPSISCLADFQGDLSSSNWRFQDPTSITTLSSLVDLFNRLPSSSTSTRGGRHGSSVYTVALDGFCYSGMIDVMNFGREASSLRSYYRFNNDIVQHAIDYRERNGMNRYISLHWRRGDLDLAHPQTSLMAWPPAVLAKKAMTLMDNHCEHYMDATTDRSPSSDINSGHVNSNENGYCGFDSIHLSTDLFFNRDFATFRSLIPSSVAIIRHHSNDRIFDTAMDLILASQSDYFFSTYSGSSYARFIWQEREEVYHKHRSTHDY